MHLAFRPDGGYGAEPYGLGLMENQRHSPTYGSHGDDSSFGGHNHALENHGSNMNYPQIGGRSQMDFVIQQQYGDQPKYLNQPQPGFQFAGQPVMGFIGYPPILALDSRPLFSNEPQLPNSYSNFPGHPPYPIQPPQSTPYSQISSLNPQNDIQYHPQRSNYNANRYENFMKNHQNAKMHQNFDNNRSHNYRSAYYDRY